MVKASSAFAFLPIYPAQSWRGFFIETIGSKPDGRRIVGCDCLNALEGNLGEKIQDRTNPGRTNEILVSHEPARFTNTSAVSP